MSIYEQQAPKIFSAADASTQMGEYPFLNGSWQGHSVAISGDGLTVLFGGPYVDAEPVTFPDPVGVIPGAAFVYVWDGAEWVQQAKLTPDGSATPYVLFGWSVALSADGNTAAVGGLADGTTPEEGFEGEQRGAVWVFSRDGESWTLDTRIADYATTTAAFGFSVALSPSGDVLAVGDPVARTPGVGAPRGRVWIYRRDGGSWSNEADLSIAPGDGVTLGESVSFASEDALVMGAPVESDLDDSGFPAHGTAWTAINDSGWSVDASAIDAGPNYRLGRRVAASTTTLAVAGAYNPDEDGEQYIWVFITDDPSNGWSLDATLEPSWPVVSIGQVASVAVSADGSVIAAGNGNASAEVCELWIREGAGWTSLGTFSADDLSPASSFGFSVSMSPDSAWLAVGGPLDAGDVGAAWVFTREISGLALVSLDGIRIPIR